jgi:hypothetical protein
MKYGRQPRILICLLIATTMAGTVFWLVARGDQGKKGNSGLTQSKAVSYKILNDEMGTVIGIGVDTGVNEEQLRATLAKAADEHQDDAARDYLASMFLFVEAYLVRDGQQSSVPAGRLRRYVPPGNPASRRNMTIDRGNGDSFTITLDKAKRTLQ